jgi:hypothetical protein
VNSGEAYLCLADDAPDLATPERMVCPRAHSFTPLISTLAGDGWRMLSEGVFTYVLPAGADPPDEAGFKIRISIHPALADDLLRSAVPIIAGEGCPFRVIANTPLLELVFSKNSAGDSAGDFMTVYPASQELFDELTAKLQDATHAIKGSPIPRAPAEIAGRPALTADNPWPGLDCFLPEDFAFFRGREDEQVELAQRLERGSVTVVLGQPGVGKSSLLRAGLKPLFDRKSFEPVYLRLQWGGAVHPLQQLRDEINRVLRERQIDGAPFGEGQGLREYFHRPEPGWVAGDGKLVVPVLIFDQFEDVFTFDAADAAAGKQVEAFWRQIANLVGNRGPETIGQLSLSYDNSSAERLGFKVVISLRQDHLPELLNRGGQLPSIIRNHFVLKPFNGRKAVEAVLGPGRLLLDPADPDALAEQIVRRVARATPPSSERPPVDGGAVEPLEDLSVEPALLSFFCQQLNEARKRAGESGPGTSLITATLVEAEAGRIFEDFLESGGKPRNTPPATEPQTTTDLQEEPQRPEEEKLLVPELELPQEEPVPAQAGGQVVEEALQSSEMAQGAAPATQPQIPDLKEEPEAPEEEKLLVPALELRQEEPVLAQAVGNVVEGVFPSSATAQGAAPATQPQTTGRIESKGPEKKEFHAPAPEFLPREPVPAQAGRIVTRRLKFLVCGLGLLLIVIVGVLVVMYLGQLQKQVELEEYISSVAAARNTFKSANKKLTLVESDLALKESNIQALAQKTREQELEAQNAKEQNSRLAGEQTNLQSRIMQLNREKAQAESRLSQWSGWLNDLTNQIASLNKQKEESNKQKEELKARNDALTLTNSRIVSNQIATQMAASQVPATNVAKESKEATAMESVPETLPAINMPFARRQVDVLLTNGQCLYSADETKFRALQVHDVLYEGAVVRTGLGSWCDLFIRRTGTTVRLAPESQIKIAKLSEASENGVPLIDTLLELRKGRIFTVVRALTPGSTFEISDAAGHSVIEGGGLGCYMIAAPGPEAADKLLLTPLRVVNQKGTSVIAPGQSYTAVDGATLSLLPSSWETMLIQLDELEAETDKAIVQPDARNRP